LLIQFSQGVVTVFCLVYFSDAFFEASKSIHVDDTAEFHQLQREKIGTKHEMGLGFKVLTYVYKNQKAAFGVVCAVSTLTAALAALQKYRGSLAQVAG